MSNEARLLGSACKKLNANGNFQECSVNIVNIVHQVCCYIVNSFKPELMSTFLKGVHNFYLHNKMNWNFVRSVPELKGIIPNSFAHIFGHIAKSGEDKNFLVSTALISHLHLTYSLPGSSFIFRNIQWRCQRPVRWEFLKNVTWNQMNEEKKLNTNESRDKWLVENVTIIHNWNYNRKGPESEAWGQRTTRRWSVREGWNQAAKCAVKITPFWRAIHLTFKEHFHANILSNETHTVLSRIFPPLW